MMESVQEGISEGGNRIAEIRFADDQAIIGDSEEGLQRIMDKLDQTIEKFNMKINLKKTKMIEIGKNRSSNVDIQTRGTRLEQVYTVKPWFSELLGTTANVHKNRNFIKSGVVFVKSIL